MKSILLSTLLVLVIAALSNVVDAKETVSVLRQVRALGYGSGESSWGGDNGRDHPTAATQETDVAVRCQRIEKGIISCLLCNWNVVVAIAVGGAAAALNSIGKADARNCCLHPHVCLFVVFGTFNLI